MNLKNVIRAMHPSWEDIEREPDPEKRILMFDKEDAEEGIRKLRSRLAKLERVAEAAKAWRSGHGDYREQGARVIEIDAALAALED